MHLFNRLTRLLARVRRNKYTVITESDAITVSNNQSSTSSSSDSAGPNSLGIKLNGDDVKVAKAAAIKPDAAPPVDPLVREARKLNEDVDAWIDSLQLATLEHERVQVGNKAYAYTMKVSLDLSAYKRGCKTDGLLTRSSCSETCSRIPETTLGFRAPPSRSSATAPTRPPCSACPSSE